MSRIKQRAVNEQQKLQRRADILNSARALFDATSHYDSLLMKHIAENIGLTKGTLYLYFKTKEEVFLALYSEEFTAVFDTLDHTLERLGDADMSGAQTPVDSVVTVFRDVLMSRDTFLRLNSLLHNVLEQNIEFETALEFKTLLRDRVMKTGSILEEKLTFLEAGQGAEILLCAHQLLIGCFHATMPTPSLESIFEKPDMAFMKLDFEKEFTKTLRRTLLGVRLENA